MEHPTLLFVSVLANLAIAAGYGFAALVVIPLFLRKMGSKLWRTRLGGVGFFLLCGFTHLEMTFGALLMPHEMVADMATSWHMLAVHVPQAVCVWFFLTGLYIELDDADWAPREFVPPPVDAIDVEDVLGEGDGEPGALDDLAEYVHLADDPAVDDPAVDDPVNGLVSGSAAGSGPVERDASPRLD